MKPNIQWRLVGQYRIKEDCRVCNHLRKRHMRVGPGWLWFDQGDAHIFDSYDAYRDLDHSQQQWHQGQKWDYALLFEGLMSTQMPPSFLWCSVCNHQTYRRVGKACYWQLREAWWEQARWDWAGLEMTNAAMVADATCALA